MSPLIYFFPRTNAASLSESVESAIASTNELLVEKLEALETARLADDADLLDLAASEVQYVVQARGDLERAARLIDRLT